MAIAACKTLKDNVPVADSGQHHPDNGFGADHRGPPAPWGSEKPVHFFAKSGAELAQDAMNGPDPPLMSFGAHHGPAHSCPPSFRDHPA